MQRYERAVGFKNINLELLPIEHKSLNEETTEMMEEEEVATVSTEFDKSIVVDVRTREEYRYGAYPDAICLPLDEFSTGFEKVIGTNLDRNITVYCASGARSAYAMQYLRQLGYTNVRNGGGLMQMMRKPH